jgi:IclR family KDG regulon transcriptional repressor
MREIQMESIRAVDRAIDVLNAFTHRTPEQSIEEISRTVSLPRATVYRILYTLERRGLVQFDPESSKYRLGFQFLYYGDLVSSSLDLRREAEPALLQLHENTHQTVLMSVVENDMLVYIFSKENPEGLKVSTFEGPRRPITFGAFGYVTMAYMDAKRLQDVLKSPIPQYTPETVTDRTMILHRLQHIREEGVWAETNEGIYGVTGIAAPVFDARGQFIAAVGINGPSVHLSGDSLQRAKEAVRETANAISARLGHRVGQR